MIAYQQIRQYSQLNNRLTMVIQSTRPEHELKIHITYVSKTVCWYIRILIDCFYYIRDLQILFCKSWQLDTSLGSWGAERGKWTSVHFYFAQKGGETVETSSFRQAVEAQFDCLSKKVIKRAVMKGYRDMKRREKREC